MKLKLRIGRQRTEPVRADEVRTDGSLTDRAQPRPVTDVAAPVPAPAPALVPAPAPVPVPRAQERRVVRAGSFCRASEVGQSAVTESGRAVVSVPTARCGRWVFADQR